MSDPNNYEDLIAGFDWREALQAMGWEGQERVNPATAIVDRHAASHRVALYWFGKDGSRRTVTFRELSRLSSRFAGLLQSIGIRPGDRVLGVLPRVPETIAMMLGTMKAGAVYVPVFTGFGTDAVRFRIRHSGARAVLLHHAFRDQLSLEGSGAEAVITLGGPEGLGIEPGDISFWQAMKGQSDRFEPVLRRRDDPAVILYTSGSTGQPKGVQIANNFLVSIWPFMRYGAGLRDDSLFWPTGDPGWGYGFICYMDAMAMGVPVFSVEQNPTPAFALDFLEREGITALATVPTLLRGIMALGEEEVGRRQVALRSLASCGEPLNAEVVSFFDRVWGVEPKDHYGSSEQGIPAGNPGTVPMPVKPGSMGRPTPGQRMAIIDDEGKELPVGAVGHIGLAPSEEGYYALGYWQNPEAEKGFRRGGWICAGDLGRVDEQGYFWFEGRADDVIKSAGYRIGPFEVESAILGHPEVAEAAVVGKPDPQRGQIVKAFVVLKPGRSPRPGLEEEIVAQVKASLGRPQAPREIEFVADLPTTISGKIQRFLLRQR